MAYAALAAIEAFQLGNDDGQLSAEQLARWTGIGTALQVASHSAGLQQTVLLLTPRGQLTVMNGDWVVRMGTVFAVFPDEAFRAAIVELEPGDSTEPAEEEEETDDAAEEGDEQEDDLDEHSDGDGGGEAPEAGGGDQPQQGEEEQKF